MNRFGGNNLVGVVKGFLSSLVIPAKAGIQWIQAVFAFVLLKQDDGFVDFLQGWKFLPGGGFKGLSSSSSNDPKVREV